MEKYNPLSTVRMECTNEGCGNFVVTDWAALVQEAPKIFQFIVLDGVYCKCGGLVTIEVRPPL